MVQLMSNHSLLGAAPSDNTHVLGFLAVYSNAFKSFMNDLNLEVWILNFAKGTLNNEHLMFDTSPAALMVYIDSINIDMR